MFQLETSYIKQNVLIQDVERNVNKFGKEIGSALKSDELTNYRLVNRENLDLNFDTSFAKSVEN